MSSYILVYNCFNMILSDIIFYLKGLSLKTKAVDKVFGDIYRQNGWGDKETVSGPGSNLVQTKEISFRLPEIIRKYKINSLLDAPCGDYNWISKVSLDIERYFGCDIVEDIVNKNIRQYGNNRIIFTKKNIIVDRLPKVDLILCRDCLVHFSNNDIALTLLNFKKSGAKYLLTTTFVDRIHNSDIPTGRWRPINLQISPFNLPPPVILINEKCTEENSKFRDKCLGLWKMVDV